MRRSRFMSLVFLGLSLALLGLKDFRWALQVPVWDYRFTVWQDAWMSNLLGKEPAGRTTELTLLPPAKMERLQQEAQRGDAKAAAFVALYLPTGEREARLDFAEKAVELDPDQAWVLTQVSGQMMSAAKDPVVGPRLLRWAALVDEADAQNAVSYITHATLLRLQTPGFPANVRPDNDEQMALLSRQAEWLSLMDHAAQASQYNDHTVEQFLLTREVLKARGWETPWMAVASQTYPIPNLLQIREYGNVQAWLGKGEEKTGHLDAALHRYWLVTNLGERMREQGGTLIERLLGEALERIGGQPLVVALVRQGRSQEAESVRIRVAANAGKAWEDPLLKTVNREWATLLLHMFFAGIVVFGALGLFAGLYLTAKLVIRPDQRRSFYDFMMTLETYAAVLLLLCCFGLFLTFFPYGQNFRSYMDASPAKIHDVTRLRENSVPISDRSLVALDRPEMHRPLLEYVPWAVLALVLATALAAIDARRGTPQRARGAAGLRA